MVSMTTLLTAYKLYRAGSAIYKQYKRSYQGKSKRKRNKMNNQNIGWGSK